MKTLCKLFGHRPAGPGWWGDIPYVELRTGGIDGVGRIHGTLHHECRRCGKKYLAGRFHVNDRKIAEAVQRHPDLFTVKAKAGA